uniref:Single domain-containing protein n=1 Tax=Lutzomyia longipalpis TaxID=7200 RepID=A0A1B0CAP8_LUTLO
MSAIRSGIFVIALAIVISGQILRHPPSTHPDYPGHCWIADLKQAVRGGSEWSDRQNCVRYSCFAHDYSYEIDGCGKMAIPDTCKPTPIDTTKDYPDCCPKFTCN